MMPNPELEKLKVGDVVLMKEWHYGSTELYLVKVIARTPTRITVVFRGDLQSTWTLDGERFPRSKGGYGIHSRLIQADDTNLEAYRRSRALRRVHNLHSKIGDCVRRDRSLSKLSEPQLRDLADSLMKYIVMLEPVNLDEVDPL